MEYKEMIHRLDQQLKDLDEKISQLNVSTDPDDLAQKLLCQQVRESVGRTREMVNKANIRNTLPRTSAPRQMCWWLLLYGLSALVFIGLIILWMQN